ncbi:MAG TPA: hypothetical protein VL976_04325, partial [Xanthobacteraceae bacterium]|nr:hypothetical protein [Xanthobacteraceae bacterium]
MARHRPFWPSVLLGALCVAGAALLGGAAPAAAQGGTLGGQDGTQAGAAAQPRPVAVPGFWDPRRRPERPDLSRLQTI